MLTSSRYRLAAGLLAASALLAACSNQTAEEKGRELATAKLDAAKGVAKSGRQVVADPSVASAGLDISTVQNARPGPDGLQQGLDTYIVAARPAKGQLRVYAYDVLEKEIGRASVSIERDADEAQYTFIPMDKQVALHSIGKLVFKYEAAQLAAK
jgi:hypothetical protein